MNNLQTDMTQVSGKEQIERLYHTFISSIDHAAKEIDTIKGQSDKFTELQLSFIDTLQRTIMQSKQQMEETLEGTVWDHLVIAFFGETNAGKSTIIETFRILFDKTKQKGQDGLIVGDGQSDFTKVYNEYNMSIHEKPFTLIDVPGIEGTETEEFKSDISKALRKAHCIFYVQGHNKQPDRATAEKIKQYLSDWVSVYSIYNVRGGVFNYDEEDEREDLYTHNVNYAVELIEKTFTDILGSIYKGNVSVQALLAMCAVAQFAEKRSDLQSDQKGFMECFGSRNAIYDFSRMSLLTSLVETMATRFREEIVASNKQKLISLARQSYRDINTVIDTNKAREQELQHALNIYKQDVTDIFSNAKSNIRSTVRASVQELHDNILMEAYSVIDSDIRDKKSAFELRVKSREGNAKQELTKRISVIITNMEKKIVQKRRKLEGMKMAYISGNHSIDLNLQINPESALKEMDLQLGDVGGLVAAIVSGGLVGARFGSWIGAAIGVLLSGGSYFLKKLVFGDGGKAKAKAEIKIKIDEAFAQDTHAAELIAEISVKLDSAKQRMQKSINKELENIKLLENTINKTKDQVKQYLNNIKNK